MGDKSEQDDNSPRRDTLTKSSAGILAPEWWLQLADPEVKTVLVTGCGGGFDFVHALLLLPALKEAGKQVVINSFSFVQPGTMYDADVPIAWPLPEALAKLDRAPPWMVKRVSGKSGAGKMYAPEKFVAQFLDQKYPTEAPHEVFACNARAFCPKLLLPWLEHLVEEKAVDAVLLIDGGSDSLMRGDEEGLGDPLEDSTSTQAVAAISNERLRHRVLVSAGFGSDRFNGVSDAASMRAVAELTRSGGFLGTFALLPSFPGVEFYRECVLHIYKEQSFRSVLTGMILSSTSGEFGWVHPQETASRGSASTCFVWPLMALLFGFDVKAVAKRSLTCANIKDSPDVPAMWEAHKDFRKALQREGKIREVENLPLHGETAPPGQ